MIAPGYVTLPHAIVTAVVGILGWGVKYFGGRLVAEWRMVTGKLSTIESTAHELADNHLHTIQENTAKTNALLEKVVDNQIELNGWLKGRASRD